jgi:hypothetical protein
LGFSYRRIPEDNFYESKPKRTETSGFRTVTSGFWTETSSFWTETSGFPIQTSSFRTETSGFWKPKFRVFKPNFGIFCDRNFGISNPYEVSNEISNEVSVKRKPQKFSKFRAKMNYCALYRNIILPIVTWPNVALTKNYLIKFGSMPYDSRIISPRDHLTVSFFNIVSFQQIDSQIFQFFLNYFFSNDPFRWYWNERNDWNDIFRSNGQIGFSQMAFGQRTFPLVHFLLCKKYGLSMTKVQYFCFVNEIDVCRVKFGTLFYKNKRLGSFIWSSNWLSSSIDHRIGTALKHEGYT